MITGSIGNYGGLYIPNSQGAYLLNPISGSYYNPIPPFNFRYCEYCGRETKLHENCKGCGSPPKEETNSLKKRQASYTI